MSICEALIAEVAEVERAFIDPKAYTYYEYYQRSGTGLDFVTWCQEKNLEVPQGWEKVQAERLEGMRQYQEQQAQSRSEQEDNMEM